MNAQLHFCVACEKPRARRKYVEILALSEKHAIHKASRIYPDCKSYRVLVPEPIVRYGLATNHE